MARTIAFTLALSTQAWGFRMPTKQSQDESKSATDWDKYSDTLDNGIGAIVAVKDASLEPDALKTVVTLVGAAVPFIPPPAGMAIGGALSLMSGLFGWGGEDDGMAALSEQIEAGFAKMTTQLTQVNAKLDVMKEAIGRVERLTEDILDVTLAIKNLLDMAAIKDIHAEYKYLLTRMETASRFPQNRSDIMRSIIVHLNPRAGNFKVALETNFSKHKVDQIVRDVYVRNGKAGKCHAREILEDIVSIRFEAYTLLMLTAIDPATGQVKSYDVDEYTRTLDTHVREYNEIRQEFKGRADIPWDWANAVSNGKHIPCPSVKTVGSKDSREVSSASTVCANNNECVGFFTNTTGAWRYDSFARYWLRTGYVHTSTYFGKGTCFRPYTDAEMPLKGCSFYTFNQGMYCQQYRAKVYRKCWTE